MRNFVYQLKPQIYQIVIPKAMIANIISDDDTEKQRIPLPNVRKEILAKVLEFCHHYSEERMTEFIKVSFFCNSGFSSVLESLIILN
jgi:hypothetical protein